MTASIHQHKWAVCAAGRLGCLLLLALCLSAQLLCAHAQTTTATAVPPSFAVQPLYVCKMEVKDLPQFDGFASPEMEAANNGLWAATVGMLDQWRIFNNGNSPPPSTGLDTSDGSDTYAGDTSGAGTYASLQRKKGVRRSRAHAPAAPAASVPAAAAAPAAPTPTFITPARGSAAPAAPAAAVAWSPPAAPPAAVPAAAAAPVPTAPTTPSTAHSYIIPRPASSSTRGARTMYYSSSSTTATNLTAAAARRAQHRPRTTRTITPSVGIAAAAEAETEQQLQDRWLLDGSRTAQSADGGVEDDEDDGDGVAAGYSVYDRPALTSPARRLFAAGGKDNSRHVCNKGTPTESATGPLGKSSFSSKVINVNGIAMQDTGVPLADAAIAVGPHHVVHVVNSMVKIIPVSKDGDYPRSLTPGQVRLIPLSEWFGLVASPCDGGYITPSATYDKLVGRFLIAAVCGGDTNQVMLSVSATDNALGAWILYSFAGESTQGTRFQCLDFPVSFHSQVGYNKDGVFLTFIQNCPSSQETSTGAMLYALPKWAVYKGATYFWSPVWTAWDVFDAVGQGNNDQFYPGAFLQLQPVIPQRAVDVQADVTYFVSDNLNWVTPLRRFAFTLVALINTGSLWLYEGANARAPAPLLVARIINRGMNCEIATPDVKLTQPANDPAARIVGCQQLDGGAMRPPGVWDGGAALYANKIYLVDRGPDLASFEEKFMPTLYWAILSPSFCVGGPCAPWFGTDWGWEEGWDWETGTWQANSDRGRYGYKDPAYYNQVFVFPSTLQPPPTSFIQGRRRRLQGYSGSGSSVGSSSSSSGGGGGNVSWSGPIEGSGRPVTSRAEMLAAVAAAKAYAERLEREMQEAAVAEAQARAAWLSPDMTPAPSSPAAVAAAAAAGVGSMTPAVLDPAYMRRAAAGHSSDSSGSSSISRNRSISAAAAGGATPTGAADRNISAAFFASGGWNTNNNLWQGWGMNYFYFDYYQWWREHYFLRNLYMNLRIPPKVNPCKYYKDWIVDNDITFGAINSKHGIIDFVSEGNNPVGLAAPAVAVRGGSMLIAYSYSGPYSIPQGAGGIPAYPGVGYSIVDVNALSGGKAAFNLAKAGVGCVQQQGGTNTRWGSYSGADIHHPSYKIWTAVEFAFETWDASMAVSNAATNINVFN